MKSHDGHRTKLQRNTINRELFDILRQRLNGHHFVTTSSSGFSWMKTFEFEMKFHCKIDNMAAINWSNVSMFYWRIYASLGLNELDIVAVHAILSKTHKIYFMNWSKNNLDWVQFTPSIWGKFSVHHMCSALSWSCVCTSMSQHAQVFKSILVFIC